MLNTIVNVGRSLPFLILMAAIIPVHAVPRRHPPWHPGGDRADDGRGRAVFARLVQNPLREVRSDVTDMGQVSGGTTLR